MAGFIPGSIISSYDPAYGGGGGTATVDGPTVAALAITAIGSTTGRSLAVRLADSFNALDNGIVSDGATDNSAAITALLNRAAAVATATGGGRVDVEFPAIGAGYGFGSRVTVPAGVRIVGIGRPLFRNVGASAGFFLNTAGNCEIRNVRFDSQYPSTVKGGGSSIVVNNAPGNVLIEDIDVVNPGGSISVTGSYGVTINRYNVTGSANHGVILTSCYDCVVSNCNLQNCSGFGIILSTACYRCLLIGNKTTQNQIELIGVTEGCYENRILYNHAEGTGDNGISITGFKNTIIGNIAKGCAGNGIQAYGERNTISGNICLNNNQGYAGNTGWRGGIAVQGGFGGTGQFNVISGNVCDDEQASPTQQYGVWLGNSSAYVTWATGQAITVNTYRYYGLNLYICTVAGTTGATPPTHTSGAVSDGGVTWLFKRVFSAGSTAADYNSINSTMIRNSAAGRYLDASGASNNEFIGGRQPVVLPNPLIASQISNPGGVASISPPGGAVSNGATPAVIIAAPTGAGGGQTAVAAITVFFLFGYGNIVPGSAGYAVNDILTLVGGTVQSGTARTIKVTSVDANGAITGFTGGTNGTYYYTALPPAGNSIYSGGAGTGAALSATVWHVYTISVTSPGSNYTSAPAVTFNPAIGGTAAAATLASSMTLNAGLGGVVFDGAGTHVGVAGASGAPVLLNGATVDASGVGTTLTGAAYTVPANVSLLWLNQSATIAAQTITLPAAPASGAVLEINNGAGAITALTFSPAVAGFANGGTLGAYSSLRVRWNGSLGTPAWQRVQ